MKTKKNKSFSVLFLSVILLVFSHSKSFSQEKTKNLEVATSTFNNFQVRYKFGNEKYRFRISSLFLDVNSNDKIELNEPTKSESVGLGFGIEFPEQINERISLFYGTEIKGTYFNRKNNSKNKRYGVTFSGVFGANYNINSFLYFGAELTPGLSYYQSEDTNGTDSIFRLGFRNAGASIVLGFSL